MVRLMDLKSIFFVTVFASASCAFAMQPTDYAKKSEYHAKSAREKALRACLNPGVKVSPTKKRELAILTVLRSSLNIHKKLDFEPEHHGFTDLDAPKNPEKMALEAIYQLNRSTEYAQKAGIDVSDIDTNALSDDIKKAFDGNNSTSSHASISTHTENESSSKTTRQLGSAKAAITRKENLNAKAAQGSKPLTSYFAIVEKNQQ